MIMVTGGTGHVGNVLVRKLKSMGKKVRVLVPPNEDLKPLEGLDVDISACDIRDGEQLSYLMKGCNYVYHVAGIVSISGRNSKILNEVNVGGARNVVNACLTNNVKRLVYTSSIHAITEPPHGVTIVEDMDFESEGLLGEYARSKAQATNEILKGIKRGLDAVIVFPTGVIGPFDYKVSEMGSLIRKFVGRSAEKLKLYIDGAYDFVDVRDLVEGMVSACEKGRKGEGYILSGHKVTIKELFDTLQELRGAKAPKIKIPRWIASAAATAAPLYYKITNSKPIFTKYSVDVLHSNSDVSCDKAVKELGFSTRQLKETLKDTLEWLSDNTAGLRSVKRIYQGAR